MSTRQRDCRLPFLSLVTTHTTVLAFEECGKGATEKRNLPEAVSSIVTVHLPLCVFVQIRTIAFLSFFSFLLLLFLSNSCFSVRTHPP